MRTEITIQALDGFDKIENILVKNGFKKTENYILNDFYYTRHSLRYAKKLSYEKLLSSSILVRESVGSKTVYFLEYKKKVLSGDEVIAEEKIGCHIDSLEAGRVLQLAGLTLWENIVTRSYVFERGEESLVVQIVDDLGIFIEVEEFESMSGLDAKVKMQKLKDFVSSLGISHTGDYSCKKVFLKFKKDYK